MVHWPYVIPFQWLGPFGELSHYCISNYRSLLFLAFWSTILVHGYQARVAHRLCQRLNLDAQSTRLWTLQTLILGYASLVILERGARRALW